VPHWPQELPQLKSSEAGAEIREINGKLIFKKNIHKTGAKKMCIKLKHHFLKSLYPLRNSI